MRLRSIQNTLFNEKLLNQQLKANNEDGSEKIRLL